MSVAILLVGHGSRVEGANRALYEIAATLRAQGTFKVVEVAFCGQQPPDIQTGIDACVARGAECILLYPYFLLTGTHVRRDIPAAQAVAAKRHPGLKLILGAPLGEHPELAGIVCEQATATLQEAGWRP